MALGDLLGVLRDAYCRTIGIEYMHIQDTEEQRWIQSKVEAPQAPFDKEAKHRILERLNAAEAFEKFLATKYVGTKRFGLEGAESAIPILDEVISAAADAGLDSCVIGMAHRGRLNVLSNIIGKSYDAIFREFEGHVDPTSVQGSGDVKYHLGASGKYVAPSGADILLELAANPSHLETVDPIVEGMVRARQDQIDPPGSYPVLPILIHGDAAFAGQGVVAETLAMSDITGYRVGGTIHLIINNQIGFTTAPEFARSSLYCSDVAKTVQAPIFHVNGDDPEACVRVARMAFEYRQRFHKDVVIDMCVLPPPRPQRGRRPELHAAADVQGDRRAPQRAQAVRRGARQARRHHARRGRAGARRLPGQAAGRPRRDAGASAPSRSRRPSRRSRSACCRTSRPASSGPTLDRIFDHLTDYPEAFTIHPKLAKQFDARAKLYERGRGRVGDGRGAGVRLAAARGPQRPPRRRGHPARHVQPAPRRARRLRDRQAVDPARRPRRAPTATFWVYDSLLSEYAALGFEYGYAHGNPEALVLWEAQFGDFINGAQVIIDQYIVAAEDKWGQRNGLVLLLPHGYEGQGPEHSLGAHRALPHARPPRTTCRSATPPRRRSTSTCCAARCTPSGTRR